MKRILRLALLGGLLLAGAAGPEGDGRSGFNVLFCPECWSYLWGAGALDMKGNCAECGRYPVEVEAQKVSWWWCSEQHRWVDAACDRGCCTREESLATVVPAGPNVFKAWYCPDHREFRVFRLPVAMQMVCRRCARPAVRVSAVNRTWTWCRNEGLWAPAACPMNPADHCCETRTGTLLAIPDPGPIAR